MGRPQWKQPPAAELLRVMQTIYQLRWLGNHELVGIDIKHFLTPLNAHMQFPITLEWEIDISLITTGSYFFERYCEILAGAGRPVGNHLKLPAYRNAIAILDADLI